MRIPLADLKRAVGEMDALRGLHVDNVYQCGGRVFLLKLKPGPVSLLVDLTPGRARVLVTDEPPAVPKTPPVFAAILRRALRGAKVLGATMIGEDRVIALDVSTADGPLRLVAEALPRYTNLLLLDEDGTVKRVLDGEAAKRRENSVGHRYTAPQPRTFPPQESLLPADLPDEPFAANHALDALARGEATEAAGQRDERDQQQVVKRVQRALDGVEQDLRKLEDPARLRADGEMLLTNYGALKQGMKKFKGVALDPKLNPPENVDRLFERARKATRAKPILEERRAMLRDLLERAKAGDLIEEGRIPGRKKGVKPPPRKPYRVFFAGNGDRILVGKGGRDNDQTTLKVAGPHDLFLHVRGSPGAHVIVPLKRGEVAQPETLVDAAHLALHYSKMRNARTADVSYTPCRHVTKPKGAKPGLVSVRQEKVLHLRREAERLTRLLLAQE
ncbi:MAG: NFACT RNA binding domain-containing protein [Planctomycetota bacterium]|jgi:predicted ribosome quality control (RQC) complex YloA/Tae2 family protein